MKDNRIWIDTMVATMVSVEQLDELIEDGNELVVANTAIDVALFQNNQDWFEERIKNGDIVIEIWVTPDQMTTKPFFWSSCGIETAAAEHLKDAVSELPNSADILEIAELVCIYGIPKGEWDMGPWAPPAPLSEESAELLGVKADATRTDILKAAKEHNRMDVFDAYNIGYNKGLATQHCCNAILNTDGTYSKI